MEKQGRLSKNNWSSLIRSNQRNGFGYGSMVLVGGQTDLSTEGQVQNPGDRLVQTVNAMQHCEQKLQSFDCELSDLVSLSFFYVNDGSVDEAGYLQDIAHRLPENCRTTITAVPVPCLAFDGLMVEIEGCAMRRENGTPPARTHVDAENSTLLPPPFVDGLRSDNMNYASGKHSINDAKPGEYRADIVGQTQIVANRIGHVLRQLGADFDDVVKINRWYVGSAGITDFEAAALTFAKNFNEPGPAATGIPIPRHADENVLIKIAVVAMLGQDGGRLPRTYSWPTSLWDWHVHLPYQHGVRCNGMIFLGGQVSLDKRGQALHPDGLSAQAHQAMQHIGTLLRDLGMDYPDVCKVMIFYKVGCGAADFNRVMAICSSYFPSSRPVLAGVPLPELAYESMDIEIDIYAMLSEPEVNN